MNNIKRISLLIALLTTLLCSAGPGLRDSTYTRFFAPKPFFTIGYQGLKNQLVDLQAGAWGLTGKGCILGLSRAGIGTEIGLWGSRGIIGPKISYLESPSGGPGIGAELICYTNRKEYSFCFRPCLALTTYWFSVLYGYNLALNNQHFTGINRHALSVQFHLMKMN